VVVWLWNRCLATLHALIDQKILNLCCFTVEAFMKPLRLAQLLVSILLFSFSDGWAEPGLSITGASTVVQIQSVLDLFKPDKEEDWPIQHADRWCWAASAEIILSSQSRTRTPWKQCIQADDAYPGKSWPSTCCDDPVGSSALCNRTGWPHFEYYGYEARFTNDPLEWEKLKDQIDQGRPVAVAIKYLDVNAPNISRGGHMGVIAGY